MHGEDNEFRAGIGLPQPPRGFDAVQAGHGNVQQDQFGLVFLSRFQNRPAIGGGRHHIEFRRQQSLQSFEQDGVVVGKQ
jgi:hypothetical protein